MVLRQQMIGQYRLFRPKNAGKAARRLTAGYKTREKTEQATPERNGGNRRRGRARRTNTLRNAKKYSAESTRVLPAKDCTASRTPLFRLAGKRCHPPGRSPARSRFLRRKETGQSPRQGHSDATKKRRNPQAPTLCPFTCAPSRTATRRKDAPRPPIAR